MTQCCHCLLVVLPATRLLVALGACSRWTLVVGLLSSSKDVQRRPRWPTSLYLGEFSGRKCDEQLPRRRTENNKLARPLQVARCAALARRDPLFRVGSLWLAHWIGPIHTRAHTHTRLSLKLILKSQIGASYQHTNVNY